MKTETAEIRIHPVANLFPMIPEVEYKQLRDDIREHGVREAVWVWLEPGKDFLWLIDGRNRRRCCLELKIPVPMRHWSGNGSKIEFVMSLNFHRRMLRARQRAMIAAKALPMLEEEARKRQAHGQTGPGRMLPVNLPEASKGQARDHAARLANVSGKSVSDAKRVLDKSPRKIVRAVESGKVAVSDAARISNLSPEKQLAALKKMEEKAFGSLAAAIAGDDRAVAVKRGLAALAKAKKAFDALGGGADARAVVWAIDAALAAAAKLAA